MSSIQSTLSAPGTVGATWSLAQPADMSPAESSFTVGPGFSESVFEPDNRSAVDLTDYMDGGKYRSIVRISMRFEGQTADDNRWGIGSGYLISPDTFVTAGHCVYDRSSDGKGLGRITQMKVYIGYRGRASITAPGSQVQARRAIKTITTAEWVLTGDRRKDVAFVRVDKPFEGKIGANGENSLRPFLFQNTPTSEKAALLGVVGYPGDKFLDKEKGAEMYELFETVDYNLTTSNKNMLEYRISTFKGQSGAPVIRRADTIPEHGRQVAIGTHCYGGDSINSASVIGGQFGNDFPFFIAALDTPNNAVKDISSRSRSDSVSGGGTTGTESGLDPETGGATTEGFLDVLKDIGRVVAPIAQTVLPMVSPMLGPFGAPIAAIGGVALGALNKAVSESDFESGNAVVPVQTTKMSLEQGAAERAVLAEAALQTVLRMERSRTSSNLIESMRQKYNATGFTKAQADNIGPKMVPLLAQAGLRVATTAHKETQFGESKPVPVNQTESDLGTGDANSDHFIQAAGDVNVQVLQNPPTTSSSTVTGSSHTESGMPGDDPESFFDGLGTFLAKGLRVAKPVLLTSARAGLQKLDQILAQKEDKLTESLLEPTDDAKGLVTDEQAASLIAHRAVVAECALQAVVEANKNELKDSIVLGDAASVAPEGFFDGLMKTVQKIGPTVLKVAPMVLKTAVPHLLNAVTPQTAAAPPPGLSSGFSLAMNPPPTTNSAKMFKDIKFDKPIPSLGINGINGINGNGAAKVSNASISSLSSTGSTGSAKPARVQFMAIPSLAASPPPTASTPTVMGLAATPPPASSGGAVGGEVKPGYPAGTGEENGNAPVVKKGDEGGDKPSASPSVPVPVPPVVDDGNQDGVDWEEGEPPEAPSH